jgi:hypothetical protein
MAEQKFLTNLQLNGNQLLQAAVENQAADPSTGLVAGRVYFNTASGVFKFYDGSKWITLADAADVNSNKIINEDGSISVGTATVDGTPISVIISNDTDNGLTLETNGLKVKKYTADGTTIELDTTGGKQEFKITSAYTQGLIGSNTDTKDSDTIEGAKRYADNVKSEVIGQAGDASTAQTIMGAKAYADGVQSTVIGTNADQASADTIYGAKAYSDDNKAAVIGQAGDLASAQTIIGAKQYADDKISALTSAQQVDAGKYVKTIQQTNGEVVATFGQVAASEVSVEDSAQYFTGTTVETVLAELYEQAGTGSAITITEITSGLGDDVLKAYKIYQGDASSELNLKGTINIPKDLVVTSGSVVTGTWTGDTFVEDPSGSGKALKLTIANQTAPVYINVLDLVKDHTAGNGIQISSTNEISLVLDPTTEGFLTLSASGLKLSGVQSAIESAKSEVIGTNADQSSADTIYGAKAYSDANKEAVIGTAQDTASAQTIMGAKAYADSNKTELIGESTDAASAQTIMGAKKYADEAAQAVLGTSGDEATDNTVYGAKAYTDARETAIMAALPHYYTTTLTSPSGQSTTIAPSTHGCGLKPMVQCFDGEGNQVICQVAVSQTGAVTISWNGTVASLTIVVIGKPAAA